MPVITSNEEIVAMHGWLGGQWRKYNDPCYHCYHQLVIISSSMSMLINTLLHTVIHLQVYNSFSTTVII